MITGRFAVPPRFVMLASFGGTSVLNYAFGLVMGWLLLPGDFGWLAFAQSILLVGGLVLQSGFSWSLARAVANSDGVERDALVRGAFVANFVLATVLGMAVGSLFFLGPLKPGLETGTVALLVALAFPFISLAATARGCVQGSELFGMVASLQFTEIFCKVVAGTAMVLLGFGVAGAVAGFVVGGVLAAALGLFYVRGLGVRLWGPLESPHMRAVAPMFAALLGLSLLLNLDLAVLKLMSSERALVGYYQAGLVLANAPYYLVMAALVPVLFVQLARHENMAATRKVVGETLGLTIALLLPIELVLTIFPREMLVALFPDSYAPGASSLRLLAVGNALLMLVGILSAAFQAIGRAKVPALTLLGGAFLEALVLWMVVPLYSALGAASVFIGASATALSCLGVVYLREAGAVAVRQAGAWILRYVVALGVSIAMGYVILKSGLGTGGVVVMGGTCYLGAALTLRLLSPPRLGNRLMLRKIVRQGEE